MNYEQIAREAGFNVAESIVYPGKFYWYAEKTDGVWCGDNTLDTREAAWQACCNEVKHIRDRGRGE